MSELKQRGIVKSIGEVRQLSEKFKVIDLVVKTDGEYPQTLLFQCSNDTADNVVKYIKVGDAVDISFNLRGREWTNPDGVVKVFNTLDAWKVFKITENEIPNEIKQDEQDDDLPF